MTAWRVLLARVRALFSTRRLDDDLGEEIQAHLDLLTSEHVRRGLSLAAARAAARRDFGGVAITAACCAFFASGLVAAMRPEALRTAKDAAAAATVIMRMVFSSNTNCLSRRRSRRCSTLCGISYGMRCRSRRSLRPRHG